MVQSAAQAMTPIACPWAVRFASMPPYRLRHHTAYVTTPPTLPERPGPLRIQGWVMTTVLVVDDDRNLRRLVAAVLEAEGYDVLKAQNGIEALSFMCTT